MTNGPLDKTLTTTTNESGYVMTMREQVGLGFSALNDLFSIFNNMNSGLTESMGLDFQAAINNINAVSMRRDAQGILDYYGRQENIVREEGKRLRGEQRVAMGASGFDIGSKSYQNMVNETDMNILNNTLYVREEAMNKYAAAQYQVKAQEIQANLNSAAADITRKAEKSKNRFNNIFNAISAAAKVGSIAYFGERGSTEPAKNSTKGGTKNGANS